MNTSPARPKFTTLIEDFFCRYLIGQKGVSAQTVAAYRDAFRLLFAYMQNRFQKCPAELCLANLDADLIIGFLQHLEQKRGNTVRTRNARLAAIHSFMKYVSLRDPASLAQVAGVLAIPAKRCSRSVVGFLSRAEVAAILKAPDPATWSGQRDRVMFAAFYNTGARVSEIAALQIADLDLDRSVSVTLHGKGRKERVIPLWKSTVEQLRQWLRRLAPGGDQPLFPSRRGGAITRAGIGHRLQEAVRLAAETCESLGRRKVTPHVLRHTTAMHLLQSGVDPAVIALWLGHENPTTTHLYLEADLAMKERALGKVRDPATKRLRYRPPDRLLQFLESL